MADEPLFPDLGADQGEKQGEPAATPPAASSESPSNSPEMPDLFGEPAANASTPASADSTVVNAVVNKEDAGKEAILGPKPQTNAGLDVRAKQFNLGGLLFKLAIVLVILTYGFFYTQLSPTFELLGKNSVQRLAVFEESFTAEQSSINLYNMMMAKFALDDFTVAADSYLLKLAQYESDYTSVNTKANLQSEITDLEEAMLDSLTLAKEKLSEPIYPYALLLAGANVTDLETTYETAFKTLISEEKQSLREYSDEESAIEEANLESILALLNAKDFRREITSLNLEDGLDEVTVSSLFTQATAVSKNEFSTILNIKSNRVNWATVLEEIEDVTQEVDPLYGSGIKSNIEYDNFSFNSEDRTITLRGSTRTEDTLNFSLISDLMDVLEESSLFSDISQRSFTKSEDAQEDEFTASFSIDLTLQVGADPRDANYELVIAEEENEVAEETVVEEELVEEEAAVESGSTSVLNILRITR